VDRAAHAFGQRREVDRLRGGRYLLHDHQPRLVRLVNRERRARPRGEQWIARGHRPFEILGKVIPAADDDHVLEASHDEQVIVEEEGEVAGAEIRTLSVRGAAGKHLRGFGLVVPVAACHVGTADPDFADRSRRATPRRVRIDDLQVLLETAGAASDELSVAARLADRRSDDGPACASLPVTSSVASARPCTDETRSSGTRTDELGREASASPDARARIR
jgi:hypothetical protein